MDKKGGMNWDNSDDDASDEGFDNKNNQFAGLTKTKDKKYQIEDSDDDSGSKTARIVKTPYEKAKDFITGIKKDVDKVKDDDFEDYIQYYRDITKNYEKNKKDYDETLTKLFIRVL